MNNIVNIKESSNAPKLIDKLKAFFSDKTYNMKIEYTSKNTDETVYLAKEVAKYLKPLDILVLNGELGAGKTVFMTGIANYFEIEDQISSPTFTIVNEYLSNLNGKKTNIYHFDVYRISDEDEFLESIGNEYFSNGISIIEWGHIIQNILPESTIYINIEKDETDENIRHITMSRR